MKWDSGIPVNALTNRDIIELSQNAKTYSSCKWAQYLNLNKDVLKDSILK
jgi:hypothetical protein